MQHFLLSSAARSLSLKQVFRMGEDLAYQTFCQVRWPETEGEAVCPRCGCTETYSITEAAAPPASLSRVSFNAAPPAALAEADSEIEGDVAAGDEGDGPSAAAPKPGN